MADIAPSAVPFDDLDVEGPGIEVEIEPINIDGAISEEAEDGSVVVDLRPEEGDEEDKGEATHESNLAEFMDEGELTTLGTDLVDAYDNDKKSREEWEKSYRKGLTLLGLKIEERTTPWQGASGVFHPLLTEANIRFQADMMMETFPADGPCLTKIIGKETEEKVLQAKRIKHDMNYLAVDVFEEIRDEHEQALFHVGLAGSAFKKVFFDRTLNRPSDVFVSADDFVVAFGTTNLATCPRATHVMKEWPNDLVRAQYNGEYRDVDIPEVTAKYTDVERKEQKVSGETPSIEYDDRHTTLEMHVDLDLPGFEDEDEGEEGEEGEFTGIALPYIVKIEKDSRIVLSVYRNWKEDDPDKKKGAFFEHYKYLPGLGFYGIGLIHLLGGLTKGATSILRQLIDAGTLANLPAGLKAKGLRIKGDDSPLRPGEFRDVDIPGNAIKDNIAFLPYKEPSNVLFQLLGALVDEGRTLSSIADLKISDMNQQAPVGTTLAIIERGMKVMSGIQARIHAAMRKELKLLAELVKDFMPPEYEYEVEPGATRAKDYDGRVDVIPVSNPNAATFSQRIMQYDAVIRLSETEPTIYDKRLLHRGMVEVIGLPNADKVVPDEDKGKPTDPVTENMNIITGKPVKAFLHQDHEAHIAAHMAAIEDPKIVEMLQRSPNVKAIMGTATAHLQEHLAYQYRKEIERQMGVQLPPEDQELPAEVEVKLSGMVSEAARKLLKKNQAEAQQKKIQEQMQDPVLQLQKQDADTKAKEVDRKADADQLRAKTAGEATASKERIEGAKMGVQIAESQMEIASEEKIAGAELGVEIAKSTEQTASEERKTALQVGTQVANTILNLLGKERGGNNK